MPITGYGRGWQEPLAVGRIARFRQWLREPATTPVFVLTWVAAFLLVSLAILVASLA